VHSGGITSVDRSIAEVLKGRMGKKYRFAIDEDPPIYCVYLIECWTIDCWYVGMTMDLERRIKEHKDGETGAVWTWKHGVKSYKVIANGLTKEEALSVETKVYEILKKRGLRIRGSYNCRISGKVNKDYKKRYLNRTLLWT